MKRLGLSRWFIAGLAAHLLLAGASNLHAERVELSISKKYAGRIHYALPGAETEKLLRAVKAGLERSGYFTQPIEQDIVEKLNRDEAPLGGSVNFGAWKAQKVEILIRPELTTENGSVRLTVQLFHITQRDRIFGKKYSDKTGNEEAMAAFVVDDIVKSLTGDPGIENTRIAYTAQTKPGMKEIFVTFPGGRENKQITFDNSISLNPAWMNNGTKILYTSYLNHFPELYFLDLTIGKRTRFVYFPGLNTQPAISPDGKKVALVLSKDGNPDVYVLTLSNNSLARITKTPAVEASPSWSPDGEKLAFVSDRTGEPQIYIQPVSGGKAEQVSYISNYCTSPDWSPKGDSIVCSATEGENYQLYLIDLKTKDAVQLTQGAGKYEDPSFSPDGMHMVLTATVRYQSSLKILSINDHRMIDLNVKGNNPSDPNWVKFLNNQ